MSCQPGDGLLGKLEAEPPARSVGNETLCLLEQRIGRAKNFPNLLGQILPTQHRTKIEQEKPQVKHSRILRPARVHIRRD
jgi:hypothetical protein